MTKKQGTDGTEGTGGEPKPGNRLRAALQNAGLMAVSLICALLLAECSARILYPAVSNYDTEMWRYFVELKEPLFDKELPFHHYPNRTGVFYGAELATNSCGFRDHDYALKKPEGSTRILILGDSMTLGWGVPFQETFPKVLEEKLNADGEAFEVINLGIGNYNSMMEVELFKRKGIQFRPDVVVLAHYVNDPEPTPVLSPLRYHTGNRSYLGALLRSALLRARGMVDTDFVWWRYYEDLYAADSESLEANSAAIRELAALCKKEEITLIIASIPELHELKDYPLGVATEHVAGLASECDVPFVDLLPDLAGHEPETLWVSQEDPHANALACRTIAETLYRALSR